MSAGTVVITGGILAGVILLCIVAVLCYCRLQYYCCKKNDSEVDVASMAGAESHSHFACNACTALAMDGAAVTSMSLDPLNASPQRNYCPTCSPYYLRSGITDDVRNGGERLGFHTYYENPSVCLPLSINPQGSSPMRYDSPTDMFPSPPRPTDMFPSPPRPYSTQV